MQKNILVLLACIMLTFFVVATAQATTYSFSSKDGSGTQNDFADLDHYYLYLWGLNFEVPANEQLVSAKIHFEKIVDWQKESDVLKVYLLDNPTLNITASSSKDIIAIQDNQSTATSGEMMYYDYNPANPNPSNRKYRFEDGVEIWRWSDPDVARRAIDPATGAVRTYYSSLPNNKERYTFDYNFTDLELDLLEQYLLSGNAWPHKFTAGTYKKFDFGIGFDPDCHYYNEGIIFEITTEEIKIPPTEIPVPEPSTFALFGVGLLGAAVVGWRRNRK